MSLDVIAKIKKLIRDTMKVPAKNIKSGRVNAVYPWTDNFYLVDIDSVQRIAQGKHYDDENDDLIGTIHFKGNLTLSFIGESAEKNANALMALLESQDYTYYMQKELGITLYKVSSYNNIRKQFNGQWWPVIVIQMACRYATAVKRDSNYFETVPTKNLFNK